MNQDTLRKAVELADGWLLGSSNDLWIEPPLYVISVDNTTVYFEPDQIIQDALAAQLERQFYIACRVNPHLWLDWEEYLDAMHKAFSIWDSKYRIDLTSLRIAYLVESRVLEGEKE